MGILSLPHGSKEEEKRPVVTKTNPCRCVSFECFSFIITLLLILFFFIFFFFFFLLFMFLFFFSFDFLGNESVELHEYPLLVRIHFFGFTNVPFCSFPTYWIFNYASFFSLMLNFFFFFVVLSF